MNIFDLRDLSENEEIIKILAENENIKIEKIISTGQTTDWQESEQNEFVILVQGEAEIEYFEDKNFEKNGNIIKNQRNTNNKKVKFSKSLVDIFFSFEINIVFFTIIVSQISLGTPISK